jgi:hypothetical protein
MKAWEQLRRFPEISQILPDLGISSEIWQNLKDFRRSGRLAEILKLFTY